MHTRNLLATFYFSKIQYSVFYMYPLLHYIVVTPSYPTPMHTKNSGVLQK